MTGTEWSEMKLGDYKLKSVCRRTNPLESQTYKQVEGIVYDVVQYTQYTLFQNTYICNMQLNRIKNYGTECYQCSDITMQEDQNSPFSCSHGDILYLLPLLITPFVIIHFVGTRKRDISIRIIKV